MTFIVIECYTDHTDRYTLDVETLDDLAVLADKFGRKSMLINFEDMTIMVYVPNEY